MQVVLAIIGIAIALFVLWYLLLFLANALAWLAVTGLNVTEFLANHLGMPGWFGWFVIWSCVGGAICWFIIANAAANLPITLRRLREKPLEKISVLHAMVTMTLVAILLIAAGTVAQAHPGAGP